MAQRPRPDRRRTEELLGGGYDVAKLPDLQNGIDWLLEQFWPQFQKWQENYRADPVRSPQGRYCQFLKWPATEPDDGAIVTPPDTETDAFPGDQSPGIGWRKGCRETFAGIVTKHALWANMDEALRDHLPPECVFSMECHEYKTPHDGCGYTLRVSITKDGHIYRKVLGVGSLTSDRAHGWKDVTPPPED